MQALQTSIQDTQDILTARIENICRLERNRNNQWTAILVERKGANPVNMAPSNFPATREKLIDLTNEELEALEVAYNFSANRSEGDGLEQRLDGLVTYFMEGE